MFKQTALSSVDSYKLGHAEQYPANTTKVYSNFTPRSMAHFIVPSEFSTKDIVWFGLQGFLAELKEVWDTTFFDRHVQAALQEAEELYAPFCGPNGFDTSRLAALHKLRYLPLEIKALPERSQVPVGVPVLTITNTLPEFYWLPNFLETWMSSELWKSSTSATTSYVYRKIINKYAELTGGSKEFVQWQGHDFSVRGMSGIVDAAKSGAGHLLSFTGTDNLPAVKYLQQLYRGKETFIGGSVPATEHSVMCAGGKESEVETFRRLITQYPKGIISIVSDTWDFWNVITNTAKELKQEILARQPDEFGISKVVFRPDSGDPVKIICGYKCAKFIEGTTTIFDLYDNAIEVVQIRDKYFKFEYSYYEDNSVCELIIGEELSGAEVKGAVECLWDIFGGTTNSRGFKTLNSKVGLIYGDSITPSRCLEILRQLKDKGFASDNIVFGIGSYTFQYQTRDTLGFAMKATYVEIDGVGQAIFKDPKTDFGTKKSAKGLLCVDKDGDGYYLVDNATIEQEQDGTLLHTVFLDGKILVNESLADIRSRLGVI